MFTKFCAALSKLCLVRAVIGLIAVVLCVQWQVIGRYIFNDSPTWAHPLAMLLVLFVTSFGLAVGVRDAGHIGLESILVMLAPERYRIWFEVLIHVLVAIFGMVMGWNAWVLAESVMPYKIPNLGLSEGLNHIPLALAGVLITLFSLEHILAILRGTEVEPAWH